jgi:membrane-associated protein
MLFAEFGLDQFIDLFLRLDKHLNHWAEVLGPWLYVVVFAIIFCETGLVVTPILPGDSLLFALGALAGTDGSPINVWLLMALMIIAAVLGDAVNYAIGAWLGPRVFKREDSWLLNKKHLLYAQDFYERWGSFTIVLCRFVPIVRTFGPFVAGIGKMRYAKFALYNVAGAFLWVLSLTLFGYWLGSREWVQNNFSVIIIGIVLFSVLPILITVFLEWRRSRRTPVPSAVAPTNPSPNGVG